MRWDGDCCILQLPRLKKDQGGENVLDRHVYVNPKEPMGCMLFWLGIRILSVASAARCQYIIGDEAQVKEGKDGAYGEWLSKCLKSAPPEEVADNFSGEASDFGTHSIRKFKMTEMACTVDGPPVISAFLRCGHSIGQVTQTYIREGGGGDQFCGRLCAGLSTQDLDFGLLPPRFDMSLFPEGINYPEFIAFYIQYPVCFMSIIPFLIALVVYQMVFIENEFPRCHPFFSCKFYIDGYYKIDKLGREGGILVGRIYCPITKMQATGIPAYVRQGIQLEGIESQLVILR